MYQAQIRMCKYNHEQDKSKPNLDCNTLKVGEATADESGIDTKKLIGGRRLATTTSELKNKAVLQEYQSA